MAVRPLLRAALGAAVLVPLLAGAPAATAAPTTAGASVSAESVAAVRVLRYNASGAAEFRSAVDRGAQIWNSSVTTVRLEPGSPADITVVADNGWPRAQTTSLGRGRIWMGRQAVNQGYDVTRIAAHEFGHILGLPDRRTGLCADLMSGSSAPTSCRNATPNARERAQVQANFGSAAAAARVPARVFVDAG
jgi:snapalysin